MNTPDITQVHTRFISALDKRDGESALKILGNIIERWPEVTGKYCGLLASFLARQGHFEQSALLYQRAIEFDAADVSARLFLGIALQRLGREQEACASWRYLIEHHADRAESELADALLAFIDKNFVQAEQKATLALNRIAPDNPLANDARIIIELSRRSVNQ